MTAHDTDEERDYESQTADNQMSLLVSRLRTRYSGWSVVSGQWSVILLRDEGVAFTATANRKFATANPSRGGRGTLAPLYDG